MTTYLDTPTGLLERVGSQMRATVSVMRAQQKTSGVEAVFTLTYEIDGEKRPACVSDVIVLYP